MVADHLEFFVVDADFDYVDADFDYVDADFDYVAADFDYIAANFDYVAADFDAVVRIAVVHVGVDFDAVFVAGAFFVAIVFVAAIVSDGCAAPVAEVTHWHLTRGWRNLTVDGEGGQKIEGLSCSGKDQLDCGHYSGELLHVFFSSLTTSMDFYVSASAQPDYPHPQLCSNNDYC